LRCNRIVVAIDGASPPLGPANRRGTVSARAADLTGSPYLGGRAVAAAVALHHHSEGVILIAGWDSENGTNMSAMQRLRAALPRRRRYATTGSVEAPEHGSDRIEGLREERLGLVTDYIVEYSENTAERVSSNNALHDDPMPAPDRAG
jgi:hypothetical protein